MVANSCRHVSYCISGKFLKNSRVADVNLTLAMGRWAPVQWTPPSTCRECTLMAGMAWCIHCVSFLLVACPGSIFNSHIFCTYIVTSVIRCIIGILSYHSLSLKRHHRFSLSLFAPFYFLSSKYLHFSSLKSKLPLLSWCCWFARLWLWWSLSLIV